MSFTHVDVPASSSFAPRSSALRDLGPAILGLALRPVTVLTLAVFAFPVATSLSLRNTALMVAMWRRPCTGLARLPSRKHPAEATQSLQFGRQKSSGIFPAVGKPISA